MSEAERRRIAAMLGLGDEPEQWPLTIIDRLIELERREGTEKMLREIHAMMTPPARAMVSAGCVCPPTSEQTCMNPLCPRRNHFEDAKARNQLRQLGS